MVSQKKLGIGKKAEKLRRYALNSILRTLAWKKRYRLARIKQWVPIEKYEVDKRTRTNEIHSLVIKQRQFPLMLSWRCTVPQVQSARPSAIVSLDLLRQNIFNNVEMCVALSWVQPFNGSCLPAEIFDKAVRADSKVSSEYERMRSMKQEKIIINHIQVEN